MQAHAPNKIGLPAMWILMVMVRTFSARSTPHRENQDVDSSVIVRTFRVRSTNNKTRTLKIKSGSGVILEYAKVRGTFNNMSTLGLMQRTRQRKP